jgi:DHA2 family multidrug resistance protein
MLDRGETKDWFSHPEIKTELGIAIFGLYCYIVHALTTKKKAFIDLRLFKDRNLMLAVISAFVVGLILYATLALLPAFLHVNMNYPVATAGLVLAPRGIGTFFSMMLVGRLINRMDPRLLVFVGFLIMASSLWMMRGFNLEMGAMNIVHTGIIQGFGIGLVFVPLSTIAFQTLAPELRTDGSSLFNLIRNIGGSFGISIIQSVLTRRTQMHHQVLGEQINAYNPFMHPGLLPSVWNPIIPQGAAALNEELTMQANMFGYIECFYLMMGLCLLAALLAFTFNKPETGSHDTTMVME